MSRYHVTYALRDRGYGMGEILCETDCVFFVGWIRPGALPRSGPAPFRHERGIALPREDVRLDTLFGARFLSHDSVVSGRGSSGPILRLFWGWKPSPRRLNPMCWGRPSLIGSSSPSGPFQVAGRCPGPGCASTGRAVSIIRHQSMTPAPGAGRRSRTSLLSRCTGRRVRYPPVSSRARRCLVRVPVRSGDGSSASGGFSVGVARRGA